MNRIIFVNNDGNYRLITYTWLQFICSAL